MLDLNMEVFSDHNNIDEHSTTTNNNNADEDSQSSSSNLLTFSIINNTNELQLFPTHTSTLVKANNNYWLNLSDVSVPGTELGIHFNNHNNQEPQQQQQVQVVKKSRRGPRSRSSQYRGVTFYRRTGRWESHIWDCGKQVYLGGFDTAHTAARAYDRAAIKFRGVDADINFNLTDYDEDMKQTKDMSKEEFVHILRRQSTGFSRGSSKFRGVTLNKCGRWEARMGQFLGKKANDQAPIKCNGREAVTNFATNNYGSEIKSPLVDGGGSGTNLDLNLGMSLSLESPQGNATNAKRAKQVETHSYGVVTATKCPPAFSGYTPNNKEIAAGMGAEASPLPGYQNWPWKMQNHGGGMVSPIPLFSSAASSGFSSAIPYSNSLVSLSSRAQFPPTAFHDLH